MALLEEIKEKASQIYSESYQMSIGELINLYKNKEIDIHPEFQRVFRWSNLQKTRLIESIMLNIPIPSIFVSQREDGVWDVVDGAQRLSTIFQFTGDLKDEMGNEISRLILDGTEYLPSFKDMRWEDESNPDKAFTRDQQLGFKRARLDIRIVKKESDPNAKYELFQRLNTGGTKLSPQEVRNCLMIMINPNFYRWVEKISKNVDFDETVNVSDRLQEEQYKMELVLRLLVAKYIDFNLLTSSMDISEVLDEQTIKLCQMSDFPYEQEENTISQTFLLLKNVAGGDVFRRYNDNQAKFVGAMLSSAYQAIASGVLKNIHGILRLPNPVDFVSEKIKAMYREPDFSVNMMQGVRGTQRFKELSLFGYRYFANENQNN